MCECEVYITPYILLHSVTSSHVEMIFFIKTMASFSPYCEEYRLVIVGVSDQEASGYPSFVLYFLLIKISVAHRLDYRKLCHRSRSSMHFGIVNSTLDYVHQVNILRIIYLSS